MFAARCGTRAAARGAAALAGRSRRCSAAPTLALDSGKLVAVGAAGGFCGSLMGLGGGFVVIPLLTGWLRLSQHSAHATSLAAVVATSVGATTSFALNGQVDPWVAAPVSLGAVVSVRLGARLAARLDGARLKRLLGIFMLCMAPLVPGRQYLLDAIEAARPSAEQAGDANPGFGYLLGLGGASGLAAGLFGVGGGALMVPCLAFLTPLGYHSIVGTSLAAMALPAAFGAYQHLILGHLTLRVAVPVGVGTVVGSFVGGETTMFISEDTMRLIFGAFMGVLGWRQVFR